MRCTIGAAVIGTVLGHGAVAGEIDSGMGQLEGRSQSRQSDCYSHIGWTIGARSVSNSVQFDRLNKSSSKDAKDRNNTNASIHLHIPQASQNALHHPTQPRTLTALVQQQATT